MTEGWTFTVSFLNGTDGVDLDPIPEPRVDRSGLTSSEWASKRK